jgi:hypothetical protein
MTLDTDDLGHMLCWPLNSQAIPCEMYGKILPRHTSLSDVSLR